MWIDVHFVAMAGPSMPDILIDLHCFLGTLRGYFLPLMKPSSLVVDVEELKGLALLVFPFDPIHSNKLIEIPD